jgi:hypothetical protein
MTSKNVLNPGFQFTAPKNLSAPFAAELLVAKDTAICT